MELKPSDWRLARDLTLFFCGLAGVVHETYFTNFDRPGLLALFAAMMGLPWFLRTAENGKAKRNGDESRD